MTVFDAYIAVDWSAAAQPATGRDSIWLCAVERGAPERLENPPTRARAMALLADWLSDLVARDRVVLVCCDFAFGYPAGFAARLSPRQPDWLGVWKALASRVADAEDNANDRFAAAAAINREVFGGGFPFWGCPPGRLLDGLPATRPAVYDRLAEWRLADARMKGVQPVWKLCYPGSVGGQTLTGIPHLLRLRRHPWLADRVRVWPFETGLRRLDRPEADGWRVLLAEAWPPMVAAADGPVRDAGQVRALARHFGRLDDSGRLAELFAGDAALSPEERAVVEREEGWILGAAGRPAYLRDPDAIYRESFAAIARECDLSAVPDDLRPLVTRVVHACGMPDVAAEMAWSPGAGEAGRAALAEGAPILVDSEMVAHGVIRRLLPKDNAVVCTLGDGRVAALAADLGTTRSAAALELWRDRLGGAVVAIGNAPTALFRLLEMVEEGAPRPALILGFPVGFVGAVESKEALAFGRHGVPFVTLLGRRGGSAMAAAAVNALAGGLP